MLTVINKVKTISFIFDRRQKIHQNGIVLHLLGNVLAPLGFLKLNKRYYFVKNMDISLDGKKPYFDIKEECIVYLKFFTSTI